MARDAKLKSLVLAIVNKSITLIYTQKAKVELAKDAVELSKNFGVKTKLQKL
jgi:hypothetical protein